MIHSMTGFGDAALGEDGVHYTLEIRSLNNRYFKANIKLPEHLQFLEAEVEKLLRSRLGRGSITYHLRVRNVSAEAAYDINRAALEAYVQQLSGNKFGIAGGIDADFRKHPLCDDLDVLIVYINALRAIYLLYLIYQVLLDGITAQDIKDVLRVNRTLGKLLPRFYLVAALNADMGGSRNGVVLLFLLYIADK